MYDFKLRSIIKRWAADNYPEETVKKKYEKLLRHHGTPKACVEGILKIVASELYRHLQFRNFHLEPFQLQFFDISSTKARFAISPSSFVVVEYNSDEITVRLSRTKEFKTVRKLANGLTYSGREHARIDIEELNRFSVKELSNLSGISTSAIYAAKRCGGHVRKKNKEELEKAMNYLRWYGDFKCRLTDAVYYERITKEEYNDAIDAIEKKNWSSGVEIQFSHFNWKLCEEIAVYNEAAAACAKAIRFFNSKK